jgi:hypothetical protein
MYSKILKRLHLKDLDFIHPKKKKDLDFAKVFKAENRGR